MFEEIVNLTRFPGDKRLEGKANMLGGTERALMEGLKPTR